MDKSPDAFRTISEVADHLETPAHVLRFWESRFPQIRPVKRAGGRRYYRPSDVALLSGIRRLLHDEGLTIRGVQKILREQGVRHVAAMAVPGADVQTTGAAAMDIGILIDGVDDGEVLPDVAGDPVAGDAEVEVPPGQPLFDLPLFAGLGAGDTPHASLPVPGDVDARAVAGTVEDHPVLPGEHVGDAEGTPDLPPEGAATAASGAAADETGVPVAAAGVPADLPVADVGPPPVAEAALPDLPVPEAAAVGSKGQEPDAAEAPIAAEPLIAAQDLRSAEPAVPFDPAAARDADAEASVPSDALPHDAAPAVAGTPEPVEAWDATVPAEDMEAMASEGVAEPAQRPAPVDAPADDVLLAEDIPVQASGTDRAALMIGLRALPQGALAARSAAVQALAARLAALGPAVAGRPSGPGR